MRLAGIGLVAILPGLALACPAPVEWAGPLPRPSVMEDGLAAAAQGRDLLLWTRAGHERLSGSFGIWLEDGRRQCTAQWDGYRQAVRLPGAAGWTGVTAGICDPADGTCREVSLRLSPVRPAPRRGSG